MYVYSNKFKFMLYHLSPNKFYITLIHAKHGESMNPGTKASSFNAIVIVIGISENINLNIPIDCSDADLPAA